MIQKMLLIGLFVFGVLNVTMGAIPWNSVDENQLNKLKQETTSLYEKKLYTCLIALKDKSAKNITYDQFKQIVEQHYSVPVITVCVNRFADFQTNVCQDTKYNKTSYPLCYIIPKHMSLNEWRDLVMAADFTTFVNVNQVMRIVDIYTKYMQTTATDFTQVKKDLTKFKMCFYPNLTKSEQWKKVVVQIELLIKSVQ